MKYSYYSQNTPDLKPVGVLITVKIVRLECQISFTMHSLYMTLKGIGLDSLG